MSQIIPQDIGNRIATSFMSYADYVIRERALPDIRDGLKPVHRRILYAMHQLGMKHNTQYKKCARTVGQVLGLYHPHGDSSVYGALVGLVQGFNMRYPLIDGHGNFGSIDGHSAAAMRYTEARLSLYGETMLQDINKNTVQMVPNFDESETEPEVLPSLFPSLLGNGTSGIAVGMASCIPPHNAEDLYKALDLMLVNELAEKETDIEDLIKIVQAPDFPTGATIIDLKDVEEAYRTGHGKVVLRSKFHIEEVKGHDLIVFTEIPYKVNKAKQVEKIASLIRDGIIEGVSDLRDESDKDGIKLVVEIKKDSNTQWVLKKLLKHTDLQTSYSMNMMALANNLPIRFTLKEGLEYFLAHVADVILKRTAYDLDIAEARRHIIEGILICLDRLDEVIVVIRASKTAQTVAPDLVAGFGLTEKQAKAIADMKLARLSQASCEEYIAEMDQLVIDIDRFQAIINDQIELFKVMRSELKAMSSIYKGERLTEIKIDSSKDVDERDLIKDENLVVTFTNNGLIKSVSESEYSTKGRRTKGQKATTMKDGDNVKFMLSVNSKDDLMLFTNSGRCHVLEAFKLPVSSRTTVGKYIANYLTLEQDEKVVSMLSRSIDTEGDILLVTKQGLGKRLELTTLSRRFSATKVISFRGDDELISCTMIEQDHDVLILTSKGQGIRFCPDASGAKGIRPMGRLAAGVKAAKLIDGDSVVDMLMVNDLGSFLVMTEFGYSKRLAFTAFSTIARGMQGVRVCSLSAKTGDIIGALSVAEEDDLFIASKNGLLSRIAVSTIRLMGRQAAGVQTINLSDKDVVIAISKNETESE